MYLCAQIGYNIICFFFGMLLGILFLCPMIKRAKNELDEMEEQIRQEESEENPVLSSEEDTTKHV